MAHSSDDFHLRLNLFPAAVQDNTAFELRIFSLGNKSIESSYSAFTLVNPVRLIIDLPGLTCRDKTVLPATHAALDHLKIGAFADSLRISIVFKTDVEPKYSITRISNREILIRFSLSNQIDQITTRLEPNSSSGDVLATNNNHKGRNKGSKVSAILFKAIGLPPRGAVLIDVNSIPQYSLTMAEENKYILTLDKASLGSDNLLLPHYAPQKVDGFDTVLLEEAGENIIITLYTRGNVILTPYLAQNKLWIKAIPR
ncbi:MAG: AMIN domain-containing protein [Deltaproteobacteria bacterium]|nr:AMIN domain-containing protein [Deltaproteobacteria bacterium]